jgi:phage-related protein
VKKTQTTRQCDLNLASERYRAAIQTRSRKEKI